MRTFSLLALLLLGPLLPASSQDMSIDRLLGLTATTGGRPADMSDWAFGPKTRQAAEEKLTWAWWPTADAAAAAAGSGEKEVRPPFQLSLRPAPNGYDVLLYVQRLPLYNQLRRELEKQKLEGLPVTCLGAECLGFRFSLPTATVAFYEGKPGDYPFVIVVQPKAGRPPLPEPPPGTQTVKTKVKTNPAALPQVPASVPASAQR